ncbi:MAG: hypothetical protein KatS3mg011_2357 [Acidimicrobiia bacterium]|nr:MAG: hypothetical protein KatS3mg011_2357 [Acidimicrobiia bacterium]
MIFHQRIKLPYRYTAGEMNTRFLQALAEGAILGARCGSCSMTVVPARPFCPGCSSSLHDLVSVADEGVVTSYTIDAQGRVIGLIRLDGADTHFPHILDTDSPRIGMRVRARWAEDRHPEITAIEAFVGA